MNPSHSNLLSPSPVPAETDAKAEEFPARSSAIARHRIRAVPARGRGELQPVARSQVK